MTTISIGIKKTRRGAIGLTAAIILSAITLTASTGILLNASHIEALMRGAARESNILRGINYKEDGNRVRPLAAEERDLWLSFISQNTVALKDIIIFKENIQKMYSSSKRYTDALGSLYAKSSVYKNYGRSPRYRGWILRLDSRNGLAVTFPDFDKIPDDLLKSTLGDNADGLNIFVLDVLGNRNLYGLGGTITDKELEDLFSYSEPGLPLFQNGE